MRRLYGALRRTHLWSEEKCFPLNCEAYASMWNASRHKRRMHHLYDRIKKKMKKKGTLVSSKTYQNRKWEKKLNNIRIEIQKKKKLGLKRKEVVGCFIGEFAEFSLLHVTFLYNCCIVFLLKIYIRLLCLEAYTLGRGLAFSEQTALRQKAACLNIIEFYTCFCPNYTLLALLCSV